METFINPSELPDGTEIGSTCCGAPPREGSLVFFCSACEEHTGYEATDEAGNYLGEIDPSELA